MTILNHHNLSVCPYMTFGIMAEKYLQKSQLAVFFKKYVAEWLTCGHHTYTDEAQIIIYISEDDLPL